jgi:dTDP-4-dehydrorhamnose reductase
MKPDTFQNEEALLEHFIEPARELESVLRSLQGPLLVLGAGGKMGPTLCVLAKRSLEALGMDTPVIAVSRFSNQEERQWLEVRGVSTHVADLLVPEVYEELPEAKDIIYLVGLKFGTQQNPELTWAVNTLIPAQVSRRYPKSRMVALSTGNVYPLSSVENGGSIETDALTPVGEYANAAVARERVFGYCSNEIGYSLGYPSFELCIGSAVWRAC